MADAFDIESVRKNFPGLAQPQIYFDNAGGAQVLEGVITSIHDYLTNNNVQHGGTYALSQKCMDLYAEGYEAAAKHINASRSEIVLGSAVTQLFRNLSTALAPSLQPGDEFIISALDHEANIAAWVQMAAWRNVTVKWWTSSNRTDPTLDVEELRKLMSPRTKLVTCTHTSNLLGTITDVKKIADVVHEVEGAMLCVDGVAFAPHRPLDMKELGVDFYAFSWYKVYGPHISLLYVASPRLSSLTSLNHFFKTKTTANSSSTTAPPHSLETLLGLAGSNYELVSSLPHITRYLSAPNFWPNSIAHEQLLQKTLLDHLTQSSPLISQITIYGSPSSSAEVRVPVISFAVSPYSSREIVQAIQSRSQYGLKWGHNYSYRLVEGVFGFGEEKVEDGVVRVSLCHYNTVEEVEGFCEILDQVLKEMGEN